MIVCCGEALIDMLPREIPGEGNGFLPAAGGAVFNTAVALGRLGVPVQFFSGLSDDMFGDILVEALKTSRVDASLSPRSPHPTTLAFVRIVDGNAQYAFFDENSALRLLTEDQLPALGDDVSTLVFGAISLIPEPCGSTYEALMRREHARRTIYLDPNIRPGFIRDEAGYRARITRMIAMSDIIKVSDEDLAWLAGAGDGRGLIGQWLEAGTAIVLETRGREGAAAYMKDRTYDVPGITANVADTVGAGDTFNAGFLAGLSDAGCLAKAGLAALGQAEIEAALTLGTRAAAVTVSRAGANPPWRDELT